MADNGSSESVNPTLVSPKVRRCLVVGGGAIGHALVEYLASEAFLLESGTDIFTETEVIGTWRSSEPTFTKANTQWFQLDPTNADSVIHFSQKLGEVWSDLHWIINCVGMLSNTQGPEKRVQDFSPEFFLENCRVNVVPTLLLAQHCGHLFAKNDKTLFASVSAKVGSIEDNRLGGWYSYRSSKAALNMALKTLSLEWQRRYPKRCVVALHPGTTRSPLSEPFSANVPEERYFSASKTAHLLATQLLSLRPAHTGDFVSWNGERLPW